MMIARVAGTVVTTICSPAYAERRLLFCDLLDERGRPTDEYTIAVDSVYAGAGETVLILDEGNSARQVTGYPEAPIRAVVVGVIDAIEKEGQALYFDRGPAAG
jgi:ethanolamine utilization protein EutN